jgi:hypothetical protein
MAGYPGKVGRPRDEASQLYRGCLLTVNVGEKMGASARIFFVGGWRWDLVLHVNHQAGHFTGIEQSFCALGLVR